MKTTCCRIAVMLCSLGVGWFAQPTMAEENGRQVPSPVMPSPPSKEREIATSLQKGKQQEQQNINEEKWPKSFTPSEKVGADSVISFPVDI